MLNSRFQVFWRTRRASLELILKNQSPDLKILRTVIEPSSFLFAPKASRVLSCLRCHQPSSHLQTWKIEENPWLEPNACRQSPERHQDPRIIGWSRWVHLKIWGHQGQHSAAQWHHLRRQESQEISQLRRRVPEGRCQNNTWVQLQNWELQDYVGWL